MLDRCRRLEERAAALYRSYAASARPDPPLCALWTGLAREEEEHARSIALAGAKLQPAEGWQTRVDGWEEAIADVERRLVAAEQLPPGATTTQRLGAALELEMSELEALRQALLAASHQPHTDQEDHAVRLATHATTFTDDPHVRLQAALLRARARLNGLP